MITGLIPHRYARALYKFAAETNSCDKVYEVMKTVAEAFSANPKLEKVLSNPSVVPADKEKLLLTAAGKNPGDDYHRFVKLVLDHRREEFFYLMALAYRDIYRTEHKISRVEIITAAKLPDSEIAKMRQVVDRNFPGRSFEYGYRVDPDIIGGFMIDVDSTRMDASISGELEQLRQNLLSSN